MSLRGRAVMSHADEPLTVEQVAQHFHRARRTDVQALLETLEALGHGEDTERAGTGPRLTSRSPNGLLR